jgi:hypothetical protein
MYILIIGPILWVKRLLIRKDGLAVQSNGAYINTNEAKAEVIEYGFTVYGDEIIRKRFITIVDEYPAI